MLFSVGTIEPFAEVRFRTQSRQLDRLARGDFGPIADELKAAFPRTDLPVRAIPFVQRYLAEMAGRYSRPVVRRFLPSALPAEVAQKLGDVYAASKVDRALDTAEQALWTQNTVLLVVLPDGLRKVRVVTALPWQVEVTVADPLRADSPEGWSKVEILVPSAVSNGQVTLGKLTLTPDQAWVERDGRKLGVYRADGGHGIGRIPCVVMHRVQPDGGRWCGPINEAVLNLQISLSLQEADNEHIVRNCAWPQKVIENADMAQLVEEVLVGPDKIIALVKSDLAAATGPVLRVVQGQVPVSELASFAEHKIRLYCSMLGLDPSTFLRVNTSTTAAARLFAAQDRAAQRDKILPVLAGGENDLVRLIGDVLNQSEPLQIPTAGLSVECTYGEPVISPDPLADAQALTARVALGLASSTAVVAAEQGLSLTAARLVVEANLKEARDLGLAGAVAATADAPADGDAAADPVDAAPVEAVADLAMNGAQVTSLVAIIQQVAAGQLPAESAVLVIAAAFPSLDKAAVRSMVDAAADFTPVPAAAPAPFGGT